MGSEIVALHTVYLHATELLNRNSSHTKLLFRCQQIPHYFVDMFVEISG